MPKWTYFDKDGTFGNAEDLIFIDTTNFTEGEWFELQCVDDMQMTAKSIAENRNALVQTFKHKEE